MQKTNKNWIIKLGSKDKKVGETLRFWIIQNTINLTAATFLSITQFVDIVDNLIDLIVLGAIIVFYTTLITIAMAVLKMFAKLFRRKIERWAEKTKDKKTLEIVKEACDEIDKSVEKADRRIENQKPEDKL